MMVENINQMEERHKREIAHLQESCQHTETRRMPFMWAPGHFGNDVEVCDHCGKIIKTYGSEANPRLEERIRPRK